METLALVLAGALAGTLAGLLGVGGGALIVPVLVLFFERHGVDPNVATQAAIGTSLATIVFTAVSSIRAHQARGAIHWPAFWQLTPGIALGAVAGAVIAHWLPGSTLKVLFAIFALFIAAQMARGMTVESQRPLPSRAWMVVAGGVIGILSSLFGIGGGSISVPLLTWFSIPAVQAIATAAAIGLPIALFGTVSYVVAGWSVPGLPPSSLGYVVLSPFLGIVVASTMFAPLGARLAHRLSPTTLQRIFAAFLTIMALRLLIG
jgi:uncharacterized protein